MRVTWYLFAFWTTVACQESGSKEPAAYELVKLNNTGILFERTNLAQFYTRTFQVFTYVDMPSYRGDLRVTAEYIGTMEKLCGSPAAELNETTCDAVNKGHSNGTTNKTPCHVPAYNRKKSPGQCLLRCRQERQLWSEIAARESILEQLRDHHQRKRRGMVNANILNYVAGVMHNGDAEKIDNHLKNIDNTQQKLSEISKDQLDL